MTGDEFDPSPELLAAVRGERARLEGLIPGLENDRDRLRDELAEVERQLAAVGERHRQLGHLLGEDEQGQSPLWRPAISPDALAGESGPDPTVGALRGAAIRHAAVHAALTRDDDPARARHYRDWLVLIETNGRRIDGQDPAASLLTQLSRCPLVLRAPDPGTYRLDAHALGRLKAKREALRADAAAKVAAAAEHDHDAIDLAQALARIEVEVRRTDRAIAEAGALIDALNAAWFFRDVAQALEAPTASARGERDPRGRQRRARQIALG